QADRPRRWPALFVDQRKGQGSTLPRPVLRTVDSGLDRQGPGRADVNHPRAPHRQAFRSITIRLQDDRAEQLGRQVDRPMAPTVDTLDRLAPDRLTVLDQVEEDRLNTAGQHLHLDRLAAVVNRLVGANQVITAERTTLKPNLPAPRPALVVPRL